MEKRSKSKEIEKKRESNASNQDWLAILHSDKMMIYFKKKNLTSILTLNLVPQLITQN
jgi:hypothetical protein